MKDYIFTTKHTDQQSMYYCLTGHEDFIDDEGNPRINNEKDDKIAAKASQNKKPKHFKDSTNHYRYYIKTNPNLEIYNPVELYSTIKDKKIFAHINGVCKNNWSFREVDRSIFDKYLAFLKSKNPQWLKDIERLIK